MNRHEKFLAAEIGIEFKAALYFYTMLFFYIARQLLEGSVQASVLHILGMVASAYVMGFVQVFLLGNFDEAERITWSGAVKAAGCAGVYTALSWLLGWFDRETATTAVFFAVMLVSFGCSWWLYSVRRSVSTKELNLELEAFKQKKIEEDNHDTDN